MLFGKIAASSHPSSPASLSTSTSAVLGDNWLSAIFRYSHSLTASLQLYRLLAPTTSKLTQNTTLAPSSNADAHSLLAGFFPRNVPLSLLCLPCRAKRTHKLLIRSIARPLN